MRNSIWDVPIRYVDSLPDGDGGYLDTENGNGNEEIVISLETNSLWTLEEILIHEALHLLDYFTNWVFSSYFSSLLFHICPMDRQKFIFEAYSEGDYEKEVFAYWGQDEAFVVDLVLNNDDPQVVYDKLEEYLNNIQDALLADCILNK